MEMMWSSQANDGAIREYHITVPCYTLLSFARHSLGFFFQVEHTSCIILNHTIIIIIIVYNYLHIIIRHHLPIAFSTIWLLMLSMAMVNEWIASLMDSFIIFINTLQRQPFTIYITFTSLITSFSHLVLLCSIALIVVWKWINNSLQQLLPTRCWLLFTVRLFVWCCRCWRWRWWCCWCWY
jgi:hypothetical protein